MFYEFENKCPLAGKSSFIHPQAVIIGEAQIGEECYIGAGAVIRADYGKIVIGDACAIEENCVIHAEPNTITIIEENVIIGHGAIVHGPCLIKPQVTVGMGAIVSTRCEIGPQSLLAAGSILPPGHIIPQGKMAVGNPARISKNLDEKLLQYNQIGTKLYRDLAKRCFKSLKLIEG